MVGNLCTKSVYRQHDVSTTSLLFLRSDVLEATVLEPQSFSAVSTLSFVNRFIEPHRNFKADIDTRKKSMTDIFVMSLSLNLRPYLPPNALE